MIEEPWPNRYICSSRDNCVEVLRRLRHRFRKEPNPRNSLTLTREQYKLYFKFAFVRNPWARAYSWYRNVLRDEVHRRGYGIRGNIPLWEFLQKYAGRGMLRPQTHWITSFDGSIQLDYIGRFESLHRDFEEVCRRLALQPRTLPFKVTGSGEDYREQYDKASIEIVSRVYRSDIEMFGYSFSG